MPGDSYPYTPQNESRESREFRNHRADELREEVIELRVEMRAMRETLAKVASALDKLSAIERASMGQDQRLSDHETRIREMEKGYWKAVGIATGISSIIALAGSVFLGR